MALWDLLVGLCFAMPLAGALASAGLAKARPGGYALATTVGLVLGVCCAWMLRAAGEKVAAHIKRNSESLRNRYFRALYFGATLWIVFALFLGKWASSALTRLVR